MGELTEAVFGFFDEVGWSLQQVEEQPLWQAAFRGDNASWTCLAQVREEQAQFLFFSICPVNAPVERRLAVAEFVARANHGLYIGNFELDMADGEIRYKTSIDVSGDRLSPALVAPLVYANVLMMDRYLPGIMSVIYGDASPAEAVAKVEGAAA